MAIGAGARALGAAVAGQHGPGQLLGLLDVGLVERVDAQDGAGDGGRDLPAHELGAEVDRVVDGDPDDRVSGLGEGGRQRRPRAGGAVGQGDPDEGAIRSRRPDVAERLQVDGHDPDAVLAGALRDELLQPAAEARESRRR